jgi:hypothetical protein
VRFDGLKGVGCSVTTGQRGAQKEGGYSGRSFDGGADDLDVPSVCSGMFHASFAQ